MLKTVLLLILLVSGKAYGSIPDEESSIMAELENFNNGPVVEETQDIDMDTDVFFSDLSRQMTKKAPKDQRFRLYKFLRNNNVKTPDLYSRIICEEVSDWKKRKVFATILIPESRGETSATSPKGAIGPWQIMPFWKKLLKIKGSLRDPRVNLRYAIKILEIHTQEAKGDLFGRMGGLYRYSGGSGWYSSKIQNLISEIDMV